MSQLTSYCQSGLTSGCGRIHFHSDTVLHLRPPLLIRLTFCKVDIPSTSQQPSTSQEPHQPVTCSDCVVGYGQFYHLYSGQFEKIVQYCQAHGVLLSGKVCPHCNSECRLDYHLKSWRCDKSVKAGHHRKRKRCNFRVSIYKNTWFDLYPPAS